MFPKRHRTTNPRILYTAFTRTIVHDILFAPEIREDTQYFLEQGDILYEYKCQVFSRLSGLPILSSLAMSSMSWISGLNTDIYADFWSEIRFLGLSLSDYTLPIHRSIVASSATTISVRNYSRVKHIKARELLFAQIEPGNNNWILAPLDIENVSLYPQNRVEGWKFLVEFRQFWDAFFTVTSGDFVGVKKGLKYHDNMPIRSLCQKIEISDTDFRAWSLAEFISRIPVADRERLHLATGNIWDPTVAAERLDVLKILLVVKIYETIRASSLAPETLLKQYQEIFPWIVPLDPKVLPTEVKMRLSTQLEREFSRNCPLFLDKSQQVWRALDKILRTFCGVPLMSAKVGQMFVAHVFPNATLSHNLK